MPAVIIRWIEERHKLAPWLRSHPPSSITHPAPLKGCATFQRSLQAWYASTVHGLGIFAPGSYHLHPRIFMQCRRRVGCIICESHQLHLTWAKSKRVVLSKPVSVPLTWTTSYPFPWPRYPLIPSRTLSPLRPLALPSHLQIRGLFLQPDTFHHSRTQAH